jgi:hypothetical protein
MLARKSAAKKLRMASALNKGEKLVTGEFSFPYSILKHAKLRSSKVHKYGSLYFQYRLMPVYRSRPQLNNKNIYI